MKIDFNLNEVEIMTKIIELKNYSDLTLKQLLKEVGEKQDNPNVYEVLKYLFHNKILLENNNIISIQHKLLRDLLDEQKIVKMVFNFLNQWHLCEW